MTAPRWLRAAWATVVMARAADIELEQAVEREVFDNSAYWRGPCGMGGWSVARHVHADGLHETAPAPQTSGGGAAGGSSAAVAHVTRRGAQ